MDLQLFIALNAMTISALIIAITLIYKPRGQTDWLAASGPWLAVNAGILVVGGLALWLWPEQVGVIVALFFVPLVMAPWLFFGLAQKRSAAGNVKAAARYARLAALCHPTTANRLNAQITVAAAGDDESNVRALTALAQTAPREYRPRVLVQLAVAKRDWQQVLALTGAEAAGDMFLKPLEVRAFGELGRTEAMVKAYLASRTTLTGMQAAITRMIVLAFGGRPEGVVALVGRPAAMLADELKTYWIAVAHLNNPSDSTPGERALAKLANEATDPRVRWSAKRQLERFADVPRLPVPLATQMTLDSIERQAVHDATAPQPSALSAPATLALIGANLVMFAVEMLTGGSTNADTLLTLGAMEPERVLELGEWWRLVAAMFLHYGEIHVGSNMFVLWVLGRLLEPMVGSARLLAIYFFGGIASSGFVLWLMMHGYTPADFLVGASGAIFALLGAETAIVLLAWRRDPDNFDTRRLSTLGVILAIQVAIDLSVPNVSFAAHASGFIAGMVAMLLLPLRSGSRRQIKA